MAIKAITGRNGHGDIQLKIPVGGSLVSYKGQMAVMEYETVMPQEQVTTLGTEAAPTFEGGLETMSFTLAGFVFYDEVNTKPLINLSSLQGVDFTSTFETGCTLSGTKNFSRGRIRRAAGQRMSMVAEGVITGAYTLTWDETP